MAKGKLTLANNPLLSGPGLEERNKSGIPYREISLDLIERDPNQPRAEFDEDKLKDLAASIKTYGVLSPILVRPAKKPGRYIVIAGERRFRAAKQLGLSQIPALINHKEDESGERTLAMQLVENIQRADLNPLERSHAIGALKETHNLTVREVADRLGISKSMVQRSLDILDLPDDLLNALREGASESKILLLAKIEDEEIRASYLKDLDVLTRNKLKSEISTSEEEAAAKNSKRALTAEDSRIVDEIQRSLGLKVSMIKAGKDSDAGRLSIEFYSSDDLQEVFRKLVAES